MRTKLSIDTLIELQDPLFGPTRLEDRSHVCLGQSLRLLPPWLSELTAPPQNAPISPPGFAFASVDFMPVLDSGGALRFHLLEVNSGGTRGVTNLPLPVQELLFSGVAEAARDVPGEALILFPFRAGSLSRLRHERALLAQALAEGLKERHGESRLVWLERASSVPKKIPLVAVAASGALRARSVASQGQLFLDGRLVDAAFHDIFCRHLYDHFKGQLTRGAFLPINPIFETTSSKAETYRTFNRFLSPGSILAPTYFESLADENSLVECLLRRLSLGLSSVIKPHAAGAGRGIAFFVPPLTEAKVAARVKTAIQSTTWEASFGQRREVFPYTVCELLTGQTISEASHPLYGHRFELRFVIYRQQGRLRIFPSIAKVAPRRYDPLLPTDQMLLNTIAVSSAQNEEQPNEHALPLANPTTLHSLGIDLGTIEALCRCSLDFVTFMSRQTTSPQQPR
jgi:hypothetical protein